MPAIGRFPVLFAPLFRNKQEVIVHCVHPLISGYWSAYWSKSRLRSMRGAGNSFRKWWPCFRDGSLQSRKCQVLFSVQAIRRTLALLYHVVRKCINKKKHIKRQLLSD